MAKTLKKLGSKVKKYSKKAGKMIKNKGKEVLDPKTHLDKVKQIGKDVVEVADNNVSNVAKIAKHNVGMAIKHGGSVAEAVSDTISHPGNLKKNAIKVANEVKNDKQFIKNAKEMYKGYNKSIQDGAKLINDIVAGADPRRQVLVEQERKGSKKVGDKMKKIIKGLNHPEWYGKYPEYITTNLTWGTRKEALKNDEHIAIGARISIMQTIPQKDGSVSQAFKDAINAIFIKVRGSNSGAFNYNAEDVAAYIECVRGILMLSWKLRRDIKLLNEVQIYQSQTPDALLRLAGYNAAQIADLKENQAIYISRLNQQANQINNTFPLPPEMTVFDRAKYISETIIKDSDAAKASYFIYSPAAVITADTGANTIKGVLANTGSFKDRLDQIDVLINNLLSYTSSYGPDTATKIAGDLLKAYGSNALKAPLDYVDAQQRATFIYDDYALEQIQNSTPVLRNVQPVAAQMTFSSQPAFLLDASDLVGLKLTIDGSTNTFDPAKVPGVSVSNSTKAKGMIITTHRNDVSGLMAISLTRLMPTVVSDNSGPITYGVDDDYYLKDCGTEVALDWRVHYYDKVSGSISDNGFRLGQKKVANTDLRIGLWSQLDYAPNLLIFADANNTEYTSVFDLDNYTIVENTQLQQMNDAAVFSEYKTVDIQDQVNFRAVKR